LLKYLAKISLNQFSRLLLFYRFHSAKISIF
jgi:hypothetical protein